MENKYKIIALFGKSGAGKDTLLRDLDNLDNNYKKIITTTTRPKRDYEKDNIDYHFIEPLEFAKKILNGDFIEATSFNDWFYGTDIHELSLENINIGVFNIQAIECMLDDPCLKVYPIYIDASDKTRLLRNLNREEEPNCQEICRRFLADLKDFDDIPFKYYSFKNEDGLKYFKLDSFIQGIIN